MRLIQFNLRIFSFVFLFILGCQTTIYSQKDYAKRILDTLCSPRYDGRGYVNNGDIHASEFLREELMRLGVVPMKRQTFFQDYDLGGVNTFPYDIEVVLDNDTLVPGANYLVHPYSGTIQGEFDIVEVNSANWYTQFNETLDWKLSEREHKIYLLNFTDVADNKKRGEIKEIAYKAMNYFPCIWIAKNKQMFSVGRGEMPYPLVMIDSADYHGGSKAKLKINNKFIPDYMSRNVIGMIPGKQKKKYIVFSAHYDHLGRMGSAYFPGANDNASGCSMLLSLAKYYMENPAEYSIVFCFFSGEEAGLEGSKFFVEHPFFKLKQVKFVLNVDIMGGASDGITVVNATKHPEEYERMVKINEEMGLIKQVKKRGPTHNSDHYYFSEKGVPAFFIYSMGTVRNYHDVYDTAENTPLDKFDEVQELLIKFVKTL